MSIKVMTKVWEWSQAEGPLLLLMLALSDHADDDGFCYPGIARLAKKCRLSDRSIQRHIRSLCDAGELKMHENKGAVVRGGVTNRYQIIVSSGDSSVKIKPSPKNSSDDSSGDKVMTVLADSGDKAVAPKPSVETSYKPSAIEKPQKALSLLDRLAEISHTPKTEIPTTSRKTKNTIPPDIDEVIEFYADEQWHDPSTLAAEFHDHHAASGWKLKNGPMKDWKAAARTWMRNVRKWAKPGQIPEQIAYFDNGLPDATPVILEKLRAMFTESAADGDTHAQFLVDSGYGSRN